jgi:hypothetical protein
MSQEWLRQNRFAHIEFRSFNGERHACIKDRLQARKERTYNVLAPGPGSRPK